MVISPHIILFLAIALIRPEATSYSIDDKSVDRASVAGTNHLNSNLWQVVLIKTKEFHINHLLMHYMNLPLGKLSSGKKPCVDSKPTWHCLRKQAQGKCQRHPKWAERKCKKSCNLCETTKTYSKSK